MANPTAQSQTVSNTPAVTPANDAKAPAQNLLDDVCVLEGEKVDNTHILERPPLGESREVALEGGQNYIFGFAKNEAVSFRQEGDDLTVGFNCGGTLVLKNYAKVIGGSKVSTFAFGDLIPQGELAKLIKIVDTKEEQEDDTAQAYKSKKNAQNSQGESVANIEPGAGDDASKLAAIEPAAGGEGAGGHGYGFNSSYQTTPVGPLNPVGPLGQTSLAYSANFRQPSPLTGVDEDGNPILGAGDTKFIDETNLGPIVVAGNINVNYGSDGFGSIGPNGDFVSGGSQAGGVLTSNGVPVVVTQTADGYVGTAGGVTVFTLTIANNSSGAYEFNLLAPLDHADGTDPNDTINLTFGVIAKDFDGDAVQTSLTIVVADDAPTLVSDGVKTVDEGNLTPAVVTGNLVENFGQDGPGDIHPNGVSNATGDLVGGVLSSGGVPVVITPTANGYVGTAGGVTVFTLAIDPATGAYTFNLIKPLDHSVGGDQITLNFGAEIIDGDGDKANATIAIKIVDDVPHIDDSNPTIGKGIENVDETNLGPITVNGALTVDFGKDVPSALTPDGNFTVGGSLAGGALTSHGVPVVVTPTANGYVGSANGVTVFTLTVNPNTGAYSFTLNGQLDHADGTNPNDAISLVFGVKVTDSDGDSDTGTITINVADDAPTLAGDGLKSINESTSSSVVNGNLVEDFGVDGSGNIHTTGVSNATGDLAGGALSSGGIPVVISSTANGYTGTANGVTVFTLAIDPVTGAYAFTLLKPLDHSVGGNQITLNFGAEIVDYDGDKAAANIQIQIKDDVPEIKDQNPAVGNGLEVVDETNLGPITVDGNLPVDFGADTPGTLAPNGVFTPSGSLAGGALTSHGVPVVVTQTPTGYVGTANGTTVFTITINNNGNYSFTLNGVLDHADSSNPDDVITLKFGVTATDADGDTDAGFVTIRVHDDGPVAVNDGNFTDASTVISGNVLSNDDAGSDGLGGVTAVTFNGVTTAIAP
ncbi:MAG: DUF5801 repeats-in-toxin domain-containing protein, partial [Alphaproteobacteria bacterium]